MLFPSSEFAFFFLGVFILHRVFSRSLVSQKIILLFASCLFYSYASVNFLFILLFSCFINYVLSFKVSNQNKFWLIVAILANIAILGYFKYVNFFLSSISPILQFWFQKSTFDLIDIVFPVGISFYTFQAISYQVDLYKGEQKIVYNPIDIALYFLYFPKLMSGPILRGRQFFVQLKRPLQPKRINYAATLIITGLFKKIILAAIIQDGLVEATFADPSAWSGWEIGIALVGYSVQIYCDFSGYTDIAMGISLLFGIWLPNNFNYPYVSTSVGEFWRRWHITFSSWLRDYIYFPLGGSRNSRWRLYRNLLITFLIGGLWHGPSWNFVLWGGCHGFALIIYRIYREIKQKFWLKLPLESFLGWALTFTFCSLARIFFYSKDLETSKLLIKGLINLGKSSQGISEIVLVAIIWGLSMNWWGKRLKVRWSQLMNITPLWCRALIFTAIGMTILLGYPGKMATFVYFRF